MKPYKNRSIFERRFKMHTFQCVFQNSLSSPYLGLGNQANVPPNGEIEGEEAGESDTQAMHK
jgi:hypothetical protein